MTEAEWLACDDPIPMLDFLSPRYRTKNRYRYRTALLFGVACFEKVSRHPGNAENWVLRRAEEAADGIADAEPHITQAHIWGLEGHVWTRPLLLLLAEKSTLSPAAIATEAAEAGLRRRRGFSSEPSEDLLQPIRAAQAHLLREVVGNPFRPVSLDPNWLTTDVRALARGVYEDRAFDRMPILADALQDAGCTNDDILAHCRDASQVHVRGCWVVDLVLGKS